MSPVVTMVIPPSCSLSDAAVTVVDCHGMAFAGLAHAITAIMAMGSVASAMWRLHFLLLLLLFIMVLCF